MSSARGSTASSARRPRRRAEPRGAARSRRHARRRELPARVRVVPRVSPSRPRRADVAGPPPHRHGGDQFVKAVAGDDVEQRLGDSLRDASKEEFKKLRDECVPLEGAHDLIVELKRRGHTVVLASSTNQDDLDHFLHELEVRDIVDDWTTADDVERTKPHPDVILAALEKAGTQDAVMVGDSRWDIEAAAKAVLE